MIRILGTYLYLWEYISVCDFRCTLHVRGIFAAFDICRRMSRKLNAPKYKTVYIESSTYIVSENLGNFSPKIDYDVIIIMLCPLHA